MLQHFGYPETQEFDDSAILKAISRTLDDGDASIRREAYRALQRYGNKAASLQPILMARFAHETNGDSVERRTLASILACIGNTKPSDLPVLRKSLLYDTDADVRCNGATMIGSVGVPAAPATNDLIKVMQEDWSYPSDKTRSLQSYCAEALGKIGTQAHNAPPVLVSLLKNPNAGYERVYAIKAIGQIGLGEDKTVLIALVEASADTNRDVERAALVALQKLGINDSQVKVPLPSK